MRGRDRARGARRGVAVAKSPLLLSRCVNLRAPGILLFVCVAALAAALPRLASADNPTPALDGPWNMTAVNEAFTVQQWSNACGPAPVSGTAQPGGVVRVRSDGAELAIEGGRRTLRTDGCLDGMPTLASEAHSTDGQSWRTRCSTPPSDPRRATINTAYFLVADDTIQIAETGRYELTINNARCIADVKRDASLKRVASVAAPAPSPSVGVAPGPTLGAAASAAGLRIVPGDTTPGPGAATRPDCSSPGAPARLEVRPSRKLLRVGDAFGFRAVVVDAAGCLTGTPIQWAVGALRFKDGQAHTSAPTVDATGKLSVPEDCADATFDVVATAAGRSAQSSVEVTSPATYEALLAQSGLGPSGEQDEPAVAVLATGSIGASDVRAEDGARQRRAIFIVVVAGLAVGLGVVAAIGAMRSRKARGVELAAESRHADRMREYERQKRQREEAHAAQMHAHLESVANAQRASGGCGRARSRLRADVLPLVPPRILRRGRLLSLRLQPPGRDRGPPGSHGRPIRRHLSHMPARLQPGNQSLPSRWRGARAAGDAHGSGRSPPYRTRENLPHLWGPLRRHRRLLW